MLKRLMPYLAVLALVAPAARNAHAVSLQPFVTADYYLHSGIEDDVDDANNKTVDAAAGLANGEVTTTNGFGGRAGLRVAFFDQKFDVGGSYSYVKGPSIDSKVDTALGNLNSNTDTFFSRLMAEVGWNIPVSDKVRVRLAGAAGVGKSRVETSTDGTGVFLVHKDSDENDEGFVWELSPAVQFVGPVVDVELGLRYAQFPKVDRSDGTPKIEWTPLGFYLGLAFF